MQRLLPAAAVLVALLFAAGCGGSDDDGSETASTTEWASNLCSSITTLTSGVTSSVESLEGGNVSKESLESAADDTKSAIETLSAVSTVTATLATMGNQLLSTFKSLEQLDAKGDLKDAFAQASACQGAHELRLLIHTAPGEQVTHTDP